jgi:FixJ family two-component response regulator
MKLMNMDRLRQIAVVDDDVSSRESLPDLLRTFGLEATSFASAEDYLASDLLNKAH